MKYCVILTRVFLLCPSGSDEGLDLSDMRANVNYAGGYHEDHPVILKLWEVGCRLVSNIAFLLRPKFRSLQNSAQHGVLRHMSFVVCGTMKGRSAAGELVYAMQPVLETSNGFQGGGVRGG